LKLKVVSTEPEQEGNVGSVARLMKNFGFNDLWIVNPKCQLNAKAVALASRANDVLNSARIVKTLQEAISDCDVVIGTTSLSARRPSNLLRTAVPPDGIARELVNSKSKIALVLGRESSGLSNVELNQCDFVVTIPSSKEYRALNVSTACAILLYELSKNMHYSGVSVTPADRLARKTLLDNFSKLSQAACVPEYRRKLAERAFRNLVSRQFISKREALLLTGTFRRAVMMFERLRSRRKSTLK
jgi:TrmH family RNA methyltransferase